MPYGTLPLVKTCTRCQRELPLSEFYQFQRSDRLRPSTSARCDDCRSAERAERYWADPERAREAAIAWRKRNAQRNRHRATEYRRILRDAALQVYGGNPPSCACCGVAYPPFLCLDHVDGGGNRHRLSIGGKTSSPIWKWLRDQGYPPGFRVLCWNCNAALAMFGTCVHRDQPSTRVPLQDTASIGDQGSTPHDSASEGGDALQRPARPKRQRS